jgi:hypothetical protein
MSFLDRLKRGAKAFTLYFSRGVGRWGFGLGSTRYDYEASVANAGGNAIVAACVKWACRTFPEAPPMVEQRTTKGWEPNDDHPLLGLLHRPNPYYSGLHLWSATLADYMLTGNAYWLKRRSAANRVVELWWVPSSIIEPKWPDNDTVYIGWYEYRHSQSSDPRGCPTWQPSTARWQPTTKPRTGQHLCSATWACRASSSAPAGMPNWTNVTPRASRPAFRPASRAISAAPRW